MKELYDLLEQAELNARKRDLEIKEEKHIDLELLNKINEKAEKQGFMLIKKNDKNHAPFVQTMYENFRVLTKSNYLNQSESEFLLDIVSLIDFKTNAIIDREKCSFMTVSEIANFIGKSRQKTSATINNLLNKGVLFEFINITEFKKFQRAVSARPLFVNPELFYSGDRNRIDATLALLVSQNDKLEENGVKLKWKVYKKHGQAYGKLYDRKTYLHFKKYKK